MGTDGGSGGNVFLGRKDRDFMFKDLKAFKVEFVECSARGLNEEADGGKIEQVEEWLTKIA